MAPGVPRSDDDVINAIVEHAAGTGARLAIAMTGEGQENVTGECAEFGLQKAGSDRTAETHPVWIPISFDFIAIYFNIVPQRC